MQDKVIHALAMDEWVSVLLTSTTNLCQDACRIHQTTHVASAALGRLLTMGVLMGVQIKDPQESLTLSIKGEGVLGGVCAEAYYGGMVRGYCLSPQAELPLRADGKLDVGTAIGAGTLSVTRMGEYGQPYTGQVQLQTGEIAEDFAYYFAASQQQPSLVSLGVLMGQGEVLAAGGALIQPFPGCPEHIVADLESMAKDLTHPARLFAQHSPDEVLKQLFGDDFRILESRPVAYVCGCNLDGMKRALMLLGKEQLQEIAHQDNGAELACRYCGKTYRFSAQEVLQLASGGSEVDENLI